MINAVTPQQKVIAAIREAILTDDHDILDTAIQTLLSPQFHVLDESYVPLLNELLLNPGHYSHQFVTKCIQQVASPASLPALRQMLDRGFQSLAYTCSEDMTIAKWFSHALAAIGTPEAMMALKGYAQSPNPEIREEMQYRLRRLHEENRL